MCIRDRYTIIDAPGHQDFIKNMITGAAQADIAFLVVAATEGVMAQTKEHLILCKTLGVGQIGVLVNKMDAVNYSEEKFNQVKEEVSKLLKTLGYKLEEVPFIPISAYKGDNVAKKSENMPWYTGPTVLEQLDKFKEPEKPVDLPLRLPIQDVFSITGIGAVPVGRVETGVMKVNDKVIIVPAREGTGITGEVKSIEMHHEAIQEAIPGDNVGFCVRGVSKKDVARGDVVGHPDNPPTVVTEFTAQIVVLNHPTVITAGYTPVFHVHTAQVACKIEKIEKKLDPATGQVIQEKPDFIKTPDDFKKMVTMRDREALLYGSYHSTFGDTNDFTTTCSDCGNSETLKLSLSNIFSMTPYPGSESIQHSYKAARLGTPDDTPVNPELEQSIAEKELQIQILTEALKKASNKGATYELS